MGDLFDEFGNAIEGAGEDLLQEGETQLPSVESMAEQGLESQEQPIEQEAEHGQIGSAFGSAVHGLEQEEKPAENLGQHVLQAAEPKMEQQAQPVEKAAESAGENLGQSLLGDLEHLF